MAKRAQVSPTGTARFRQMVERCGRPDVHLSLVAPAKDRVLRGLADQNRVMTVWQAHRGGTDHGVVGLFPEDGVQFLVFEKSLRAFANKRIVGIDYGLLDQPRGKEAMPSVKVRGATAPKQVRHRIHAASPLPARVRHPEPIPPPGPLELKDELQRIERMLTGRRYDLARDHVRQLLERLHLRG